MKKFLLLFFALLSVGVAHAHDAYIDGIYYNLVDGEATVTQGGGPSYSGDIIIPSQVDYNGVTYSVTSIGDYAFRSCSGLTSIEIPASVISIGNYAFSGCRGLTSIEIPNSVTSIGNNAFSGCSGLTSIEFPNSVTSIGDYAFSSCTGLTSIEIPNSVTSIGNYAFSYCGDLTSIEIPNSVTSIGDYAFSGCSRLTSATIGTSVTKIGSEAFWYCSGLTKLVYNAEDCSGAGFSNYFGWLYGCSNLTEVVIGESVKKIPSYIFYKCTGLTSIEIPNSVTSIGSEAFYNCSGLTSVYIGSSVTSIGNYAFGYCSNLTKLVYNAEDYSGSEFSSSYHWLSRCSNLTEVVIGESVKTIPSGIFYNCSGLTSIEIPTSVTSIGSSAFSGCSGLTSIEIPNSVNSIGEWAFSYCGDLTSIEIPESVTEIGYGAFNGCNSLTKLIYNAENCSGGGFSGSSYHWLNGCSNLSEVVISESVKTLPSYFLYKLNGLTSIEIPASVISIGNYAFSGCRGLTSIEIPNSVTSIGNNAFSGCSGLTSIEFPNSVTSIGDYAFSSCTGLTSIEIPNSVTSIGSSAFSGCSGLTSIEIPNSVTSIGSSAFSGCSGLTSIEIPNSVTSIGESAFWNCSSLTSIEIPNSVTSIGDYALRDCIGITKLVYNAENCSGRGFSAGYHWLSGCSNLTEVVIGESVKTIPNYLLNNCNDLTKLIYNGEDCSGNGFSSGSHWLSGCSNLSEVVIGESVKTLPGSFLYECSNLTSIEIPNSVTSIGSSAFYGCSGLTSIEIPNSVTSIGNYALRDCIGITKLVYNAEECSGSGFSSGSHWLSGCSNLTEVVIGESVKTLPGGFLDECSGLTSIEIPNSVTSIGYYAFRDCIGLTKLIYNAENCSGYGFSESSYSHWLSGCSNLTEVVIGEWVKKIPNYFLYNCNALTKLIYNAEDCTGSGFSSSSYSRWLSGCSNLTEVVIGESVKNIPNYFLYNCSSLTSIEIPNSVTEIGTYAFYNCSGLTSIEIPNSVTEIGRDAFWYCGSLTKVEISDLAAWCGISFENKFSNPLFYANLYLNGSEVTNLEIPNSVAEIGNYAFCSYRSLTSIEIPNSVTSIGNNAFSDCIGLTKLIYSAENCSGEGFTTNSSRWLYGCSNLTEVVIGESVKSIPGNAFYGCSMIETVNTPSLEAWTAIEFGNEYSNPTYYAKKLLVNGETIRRLTLPEDLTELHSYAFINCEPLVTVTCGSEILSAGNSVFSGCTGLQRISFAELPDFLQISYFNGQSALTYNNNAEIYIDGAPIDYSNIEWPETLTEIPDYAFYNRKDLKGIQIPETVVSIGKYAFAASGLNEANLPASLQMLGEGAFNFSAVTSVYIPCQIQEIPERAFYNCKSLNAVTFSEGLKSIGERAFYDCTSLKSLTFPAGMESIGNYAFNGCTSLKSLTFSEGLQSIGNYAFNGCTSFYYLTFPAGLQSIGDYAFNDCTSLYSVTFPEGLQYIGLRAFYNCRSLNSLSFSDGLQTIGSYAFSNCSSLKDVIIDDVDVWANVKFGNEYSNPIYYARTFRQKNMDKPIQHLDINYIENVSDYAFYNASNLQTIRVENASIGRSAFSGCNNVTDLCVDTEEISNYAFSGMSGLQNIYSLTSTPPAAEDNVFSKYTNINLYVPQGSVSAYENAENCWWRFLDIYASDFADIDSIFDPDYTSGVADVENEAGSRVYSANGCIYVDGLSEADSVGIFNMQGVAIHQGRGATAVDVMPGIYIVRVNNQSTKLSVR